MSTPLVILAVILAIFALVLIPMMMTKEGGKGEAHHATPGSRPRSRKKRKR